MTLADYLAANDMSYAAFGRKIRTPHASTVRRYALFLQPPNAEMLKRIHDATAGSVTPNDFFPFVDPDCLPRDHLPADAVSEPVE